MLEQLGLTYPANVTVRVIEEGPRNLALILGSRDQYSDADLQAMPPEISRVVRRSFTDAGFNAFLVMSPVEAVFLETGYRVPDGTHIHIYQATATEAFFPIPEVSVASDTDEISEFELEEITGGASAQSVSRSLSSTIPGALGRLLSGRGS